MIGATRTLIARAADDLSFDGIKMDLDAIRLAIGSKVGGTDDEAQLAAA